MSPQNRHRPVPGLTGDVHLPYAGPVTGCDKTRLGKIAKRVRPFPARRAQAPFKIAETLSAKRRRDDTFPCRSTALKTGPLEIELAISQAFKARTRQVGSCLQYGMAIVLAAFSRSFFDLGMYTSRPKADHCSAS